MSDTSIRPTGSCTTSNLTSPAGAAVVLDVGLGVVRAVAGVVVIQGFHAVFVGGEQVFEHLFHGNFVALEFGGVVGGVGGDGLIDEFLHHADEFQVAVVAGKLPQGFVLVFEGFKLGYDLFEDAVFGGFDGNEAARGLDAVGGVGNLRTGFRRHECGEGGVAQAVFDDVLAQAFPIEVQRLGADGIEVFFVGVDGQLALRINGLAEQGTRAVFFGEVYRGFEEVILHGFKGAVGEADSRAVAVFHAVFGEVIGVVDHADTEGAAVHGGGAGGFDGVVLVVQKCVEGADGEVGQLFEFVQTV